MYFMTGEYIKKTDFLEIENHSSQILNSVKNLVKCKFHNKKSKEK